VKWIKLFENFSRYYRASDVFLGEEVVFKPENFYEEVGYNNEPSYNYGSFSISEIPEVCASKYIGGSVLGSFSMLKNENNFYIYTINEAPSVDISHWNIGDFEYLEEVRYRKEVIGKFIGKITLSDYQYNIMKLYYEYLEYRLSEDDDIEYDDKFDVLVDLIENDEFKTILNKIHVN
jgi:hypothetical protein